MLTVIVTKNVSDLLYAQVRKVIHKFYEHSDFTQSRFFFKES